MLFLVKLLLAGIMCQALADVTASNYLSTAKALIDQKQFDEAEVRLLRCTDRAFEIHNMGILDDAMFVWARIPIEHRKSIELLNEHFERWENSLLKGRFSSNEADSLVYLYGFLDQEDRGVRLYDKAADLTVDHSRVQDLLRPHILHALLATGRYEDLFKNTDLKQVAALDKKIRDETRRLLSDQIHTTGNAEKKQKLEKQLAAVDGSDAELIVYYEALLRCDRDDEAAWAANKILELGKTPAAYSALSSAARRAGKTRVANEFLDKGKTVAPTTKPG